LLIFVNTNLRSPATSNVMNLISAHVTSQENAVAELKINTRVFGIYKRNGRVYTQLVKNVKAKTLQAIIKGKVSFDSTLYTDGFRSYDSIVHLGYQKHYRIYHQENYAIGDVHINGIEGFWGYAKVRLVKFRGLSKNTFYLHLKECEFRFNYRKSDLYKMLLKITKKIIFC
jgi:transposase